MVIAEIGVAQGLGSAPLHLRSRPVHQSAVKHTPQAGHLVAKIEDGVKLDRESLKARGINLLGYIPGNGVVISTSPTANFEGSGLAWVSPISAGDRFTPTASVDDSNIPAYYVVEFFSDVDMSAARSLLLNGFITIQENPYLLPTQLLVFATQDQLTTLAGNDVVEAIFPAAAELSMGIPVSACSGPMTDYGTVPMMAAAISGGWAVDSNGTVNLTYSFGPLTDQIPQADLKTAFRNILQQWSSHARIAFTEGTNRTASRNIDLTFALGAHGDSMPFDGQGGVLAHTFYPAPPNSEPIAGDMHLDNAENWTNGGTGGIDFSAVALHELGHALGLGHSTSPLDVMYPFYRRNMTLSQGDVLAIQQLYPATQDSSGSPVAAPLIVTLQPVAPQVSSASVSLTGTVSGGQTGVVVNWSTDRGALGMAPQSNGSWSIGAIPLAVGLNTITITARDSAATIVSQQVTVTRVSAAPSLGVTIAPVTAQVSTATIVLNGTASGAVAQISWSTDRGASGVAVMTGSSWMASGIFLATGRNTITVIAKDSSGAAVSQSVAVTRTQSTPSSGGPVAPVLTITTPTTSTFTTTVMSLNVKGAATHPAGIQSIRFHVLSTGTTGAAQGTVSWDTGTLGLVAGLNTITIDALALDGGTATATIQVTVGGGTGATGGSDTTPPSITISNPTTSSVLTSNSSITISGVATDNIGVKSVQWSTATQSGIAVGTSHWSTSAIPLYVGMNNIVIRAYDAAGNSSWRSVSVTRQ